MSKKLSSPAKNKYQEFLREKEAIKRIQIKPHSKFSKEKALCRFLQRFKIKYSGVEGWKKIQREVYQNHEYYSNRLKRKK